MNLRDTTKIVVHNITPPILLSTGEKLWGKLRFFMQGSNILPDPRIAAEIKRLSKLPRKVETRTSLLGREISTMDAASLLQVYEYFFKQRSCEFKTGLERPRIIDCGSNVGATVFYWKSIYPNAEVIAFEPDPDIFKFLTTNCEKLDSVTLIQAGLWIFEGEIDFLANGIDGGHVADFSDGLLDEKVRISIPVKRLRDYLNEPCDMLKIDIEGAEVDVLKDCLDLLHNVRNIFVEYHSFVDRPQRLGEFFEILENSGYRIHIQDEKASRRPFVDRKVYNSKDLRLDVFAFRE
jgi:FkbM family methyltransferase